MTNENGELDIYNNFQSMLEKEILYKPLNHKERVVFRGNFVPGSIEGIVSLLKVIPQHENAKLTWLLTSGIAIDAITGLTRNHHDTDVVIFEPDREIWGSFLVDAVSPNSYWCGMDLPKNLLADTAWEGEIMTRNNEFHKIYCVHPAILLVQKCSNDSEGNPPRQLDVLDAVKIALYWKQIGSPVKWITIIECALLSLPPSEQKNTRKRVNDYISGNWPL